MHAIILAGGLGTRLRGIISDVPKPLAPIAGRPFLAWLLEHLARQGVTSATLCVHYQWEKIRDYFASHPAPFSIDFSVEKTPLGTGGAMALGMSHVWDDQPVFVLNGDTFVSLDFRKMVEQHVGSGAPLSLALRLVEDTSRYGRVRVENYTVTAFMAGLPGEVGLINAGVYVMSPRLFAGRALPEAFSFERDFVPKYMDELKPRAFIASDYFIDIGVPDDYVRACRELPDIIV